MWLTRKLRQLPAARVVFADIDMGGVYFSPWDKPQFDYGLEVPPSNGTIVVSTRFIGDDFTEAAVLAHEFRHHWQVWNGWDLSGGYNIGGGDWDDEMRRYFSVPHEFDALRFEASVAPCAENLWRMACMMEPDL